jgi:hypothetical protein
MALIFFVPPVYISEGCFPLVMLKLNCGVYDILLVNQNGHQYAGRIKLGVVRSMPVFAGIIASKIKSL